MEKTIIKNVELPFFWGFYNSPLEIQDDDIDAEIEYYNEECGMDISDDNLNIDYSGYHNAIVNCFVEAFKKYLPSWVEKIELPELVSPSEYNFSTDKIYVTVTLSEDWREQIKKFVEENREWLKERIAHDWSSRSGFTSFIHNNLEPLFLNFLYAGEPRYVSIIMGYQIEIEHKHSFKNEECDMYWKLIFDTQNKFYYNHCVQEFISLNNEIEETANGNCKDKTNENTTNDI